MDAFIGTARSIRIWLNDGGIFADSGQRFGDDFIGDISLGDLDGDGDLDALATTVWFNNGAGVLTDSGQNLRSSLNELGDLDGDGDLDAFSASSTSRVWLNDGVGQFIEGWNGFLFADPPSALSLGDLDGDGDLDAFVDGRVRGNRVWVNQNPTLSIAPAGRLRAEGDSGTSAFSFSVTRSIDTGGTVSIDYAVTPSGDNPAEADDFLGDAIPPSGTLTFGDGVSSLALTIDVKGDTDVENDEGFVVTLSNPSGSRSVIGNATATGLIRNDDNVDLGDLPPPFPTLLSENGPSHIAVGPTLGFGRDTEVDGQVSAAADGDDANREPNDEDGVEFSSPIHSGASQVTVHASAAARLDAWIDFNGDRSFGNGGEQVFVSQVVSAGSNLLSFVVPADARQGQTFARFRLSTGGGLPLFGEAADGEVEDYTLTITDPSGNGLFADSGQSLGDYSTDGVSLGDVDGDGDLDAFTSNYRRGNRVWLNNGSGDLTDSGQSLGDHNSEHPALGDLDGDGDLDAFVASGRGLISGQANRIWLNDGGVFSDSGQILGDHSSAGISLGDLDGDGDLDAFVANWRSLSGGSGNRIWLNSGGVFRDNGQSLGDHHSRHVALGDLDSDGDLDAFVVNAAYPSQGNRVWLNNSGTFSDSGQSLDNTGSYGVSLGDLDGDGDLDAFVANRSGNNRVWLNDSGFFTDSGQVLGDHRSFGVSLGDLDDDGDLDAFVSNSGSNRVWINQNPTLSVFPAGANKLEGNGSTTPFTFEIRRTGDTSGMTPVDYTVTGTGSNPADEADFGGSFPNGRITFAPSETSHLVTLQVTGDAGFEADETFALILSSVTDNTLLKVATAVGTIENDDDPPTSLLVDSLAPTRSGFVVEFRNEFKLEVLNLSDTQIAGLGPADVVLEGTNAGQIAGSVVVDSSARRLTFLRTGGPLAADDYTVTLRSAEDGFKSAAGQLLDGDGDGTAGDDFIATFSVTRPDSAVISLPDFVRGPGQSVNLPAGSSQGIPISLSDSSDVRAVDFQITFDPSLINITGAVVGPGMPPGTSVVLNSLTPGLAVITFFSPAELPSGPATLANLQALVPQSDANQILGTSGVLDVHSVTVRDSNNDVIPVIVDDALHLVSYFADVSGNGRINAIDAAQVARIAALIDTGFSASLLTDPIVVGDISGNRRINAADASRVAQFAALIDVPEIPPIPAGVLVAGAGGVQLGPGLPGAAAAAQNVSRRSPSPRCDADSADTTDLEAMSPIAVNNPRPAVDRVMADFGKPLPSDSDDELSLALEDAVEKVLSSPAAKRLSR